MSLLKKNIVYLLVGIFLQPSIFNSLHFALVVHDYRWEFGKTKEGLFKAKNEFHNCERYLFKVPPTTELNLTDKISFHLTFLFREVIENEIKTLIQNPHFSHHKRGPPNLIQNYNQHKQIHLIINKLI